MRIILHSGMHKTGTTSVQSWLRDHADELERAGLRYYRRDTEILIRETGLFDPNAVQAEIARAEAEGIEVLIFSHENISTYTARELEGIRAVLAPHDVTFVVVFRHWMGFFPSRWAQNCRRRDAQSLPAFLAHCRAMPDRMDVRYDIVLRRMSAVPDANIVAISYEHEAQAGGVAAAVLRQCRIPEALLANADPNRVQVNTGDPAAWLDTLRLFNGAWALEQGLGLNEMWDGFGADRSIAEVFDFGARVDRILAGNTGLRQTLEAAVDGAMAEITLSAGQFAELEAGFDRVVRPFLLQEAGEHAFPRLPDRTITTSRLDVRDLASQLRAEMVESLFEAGAVGV